MMISIVVPTYRRKENIRRTIELLKPIEDRLEYEVIFVDDGSGDGTAEELMTVCNTFPNVCGLVLESNVGQQNATLAGIREAKYPFVATFDDDLSDDPERIIDLLDKLSTGYDVVYGVPVDKHTQKHRLLGTRLKDGLFFFFLGKPFGQRLTSFRVMSPTAVEAVKRDRTAKVYLSAAILRETKNMTGIPVSRLTNGGPSNYTVWKLIRLMWQIVSGYTWVRCLFLWRKNETQYVIKERY